MLSKWSTENCPGECRGKMSGGNIIDPFTMHNAEWFRRYGRTLILRQAITLPWNMTYAYVCKLYLFLFLFVSLFVSVCLSICVSLCLSHPSPSLISLLMFRRKLRIVLFDCDPVLSGVDITFYWMELNMNLHSWPHVAYTMWITSCERVNASKISRGRICSRNGCSLSKHGAALDKL